MAEYLGRGLFSKWQEVTEVSRQVERVERVERRPLEVRENMMTGLEVSKGRLRVEDRRGGRRQRAVIFILTI